MSELVPLFPLPDAVLLPRAVMPLHIFEERYKVMTADALAGDRRIILAKLRPGWEKGHSGIPPIEEVVCVGKILQHEKLADGRFNFLLQGEQRVRVIREEMVGLYRAAEVEPVASPRTMEIDVADLRQRLIHLFIGPLSPLKISTQFEQLLRSIISTVDAADVIAFHLLPDPVEKQLMLEETDARRRILRLTEQLDRVAAALKTEPDPPGRGIHLN